ncbi:hypothetical protein ACTHR6_01770 [Ralstonia holmesii]|uniref:hypothetical protein n=1 Tax=Ralstonia TaxID=48736 RepID=UPI00046919D7|nr:hypothetical protein [Ralstonia pickettii]
MILLPYIVATASLFALSASLYKDRKLEPKTSEVKRALRIHHLGQAVLVVLALWGAVDGANSAKQQRIVLLEAEATATASKHATAILDAYVLGLLPAGTVIRNYESYQASLKTVAPAVRESFDWSRHVSPELESQREAGLRSFKKLQSIAREVQGEGLQYGSRYPDAMTKWAERTLELKESDLLEILSDSATGEKYASLVGLATGTSIAKHHQAIKRIEEE